MAVTAAPAPAGSAPAGSAPAGSVSGGSMSGVCGRVARLRAVGERAGRGPGGKAVAARQVRGGLSARERVGFLPGGGFLRAVGQVRRPRYVAERGLVGDVVGPAACEVLIGSPVVLRTEYAGLPSCRAWRSAPVNNASNDVARLRARPPAVPAQEGT